MRSRFESVFRADLSRVRLHSGASARSLLDRLGARAATRGSDVLVHPSVDLATLGHELAHVVQAQRTTGDPEASAHLVAPGDTAEREAERASEHLVTHGGTTPLRIVGRLKAGAIALRSNAEAAAEPALGLEQLSRPARVRPRSERRAPARGPADREDDSEDQPQTRVPQGSGRRRRPDARAEAAVEDEPATAQAQAEDRSEPSRAQAEGTAGPSAADTEAVEARAAGGLPAATADRLLQTREALTTNRDAWVDGSSDAGTHVVDPCSPNAVGPGRRPFARGPPLEFPPTRADRPTAAARPVAPDSTQLDRARRSVTSQLGLIPNERIDRSGRGDSEQDAERRSQLRTLERGIDDEIAEQTFETLTAPTVDATGDANPQRATTDSTRFESRHGRERTTHRALNSEDFGEDLIAPHRDPTLDHDIELDALEIPQIDVQAPLQDPRLQLIATEANVGAVSIQEIIAVPDSDIAQAQDAVAMGEDLQLEIDRTLETSERDLQRSCATASEEQTRLLGSGREGVSTQRQGWLTEVEGHLSTRSAEAQTLVREASTEVSTVQSQANADALTTVTNAQAEASTHWRATGDRAKTKAEVPEDRSWWQRGLDWFSEQLERLSRWIDDFIEAAKEFIDDLLAAAANLAHAIIDVAHDTITGVLDGLHDGLDFIADNLPGELGEIVRRHRHDVHEFLDGVQGRVDQWAEELHQDVDDAVEALRETLHGLLDGLRDAAQFAIGVVQTFLDEGLMGLLRRISPELADLVDSGLDAPVRWAAEALSGWIDGLFDLMGFDQLQQTLTELHEARLCEPPTEEEQAEACRDFEDKLDQARSWFDELLRSPLALRIQELLQQEQDQQAAQQASALTSFLDFVRGAVQTVSGWWDSIVSAVGTVVEFFSDIAATVWNHIAEALGIDPNIDPIQALLDGIQALWDAVVEAMEPVVQGLRDAWAWLRDSTPLGAIIDFFAGLPDLLAELGRLWDEVTAGVGDWLARAAQVLSETILPAVEDLLGWAADLLGSGIDVLASWGRELLQTLGVMLEWEAGLALIDLVVGVVQRLLTPLHTIAQIFFECVVRFLRWVAHVVRNLLHYARVFVDVCVGIVQAIVFMPVGTVAFLFGAAWLYLVPQCYKGPILDFLLDLLIRFIEYLPEPADFLFAAIYNGALEFFRALREAPQEQKIAAMDLFASIFAGNAEVAAGFLVGLVEGVWESTGGTIIFLVQAVAWLISLPFRLIRWAGGLLSGDSEGAESGLDEPPADGAAPSPDAESADEDAGIGDERDEDVQPDDARVLDDDALDSEGIDAASATGGPSSADPDSPPTSPEGLSQVGDMLQQMLREGVTRQDVESLLDSLRQTLRTMVGRLARDAATSMLEALNRPGAGFSIGRVMGTIVGMILVEVLLAIFTGGGSAAITAAKTAITAGRGAARLAAVFQRIRRAVEPLLRLVARLKSALGRLVQAIRRWLDDVVRWMRNILQRARPRARPRPRGPRPRPRGRPGAPRRPRPRRRRQRRRRRGGPLRAAAERAARFGWGRVALHARTRVIRESQVRSILRGARAPTRPGIRIRLSVDRQGTDGWRVRARASQGRRRATMHHGRGWVARDRQRRRWYTTARDQDSVHRRALDDAKERIERRAARIVEDEPEPRRIHEQLQPYIRSTESRPQPRLLGGIRMEIGERRFREARGPRGAEVLRYRYEIGPNMTDGDIDIIDVNRRMSQNPTRSSRHYLLRTAAPSITNADLGPYRIDPNQTFRIAGREPVFEVHPPRSWEGTRARNTRWDACLTQTDYAIERYEWDDRRNRLVRQANVSNVVRAARTRAMMSYVVDPGVPIAVLPQPVVASVLGHDDGRSPRGMGNVHVEDARDPTSHFRSHHVLGPGTGGAQTRRQLALRSIHNHVPGPGGAGWTATAHTNRSSAWTGVAVANRVLRRAHDQLSRHWTRHRDELVRAHIDNPPYNTIELRFSGTGFDRIAYRRFGGLWPLARLPAYLYPGHTGDRPVFAADLRSPEWRHWVRHPGTLIPNLSPKSRRAYGQNRVLVRLRQSPAFGGWFVATMFPTN
ncbi:MAG: DUF4157 domain-containing protein [Nannocystaceae bacterium]